MNDLFVQWRIDLEGVPADTVGKVHAFFLSVHDHKTYAVVTADGEDKFRTVPVDILKSQFLTGEGD